MLYHTDRFALPLPPDHRFPLAKYARLGAAVASRVPDLLAEPPAATDAELVRAHDAAYVAAIRKGTLDAAAQRRIGFPWSPALVERSCRSVGATLAACRTALATGAGVNLAGGTHHAHRGFGAGFCVFNDAAVATLVLLAERVIARAAIIDLDVHQGDGTASILAGNAAVFTFSMHGRDNYPFRKAAGDLDIELADGTADAAYLAALDVGLDRALAGGGIGLAIYLAGADPYAGDRLGRLALTKEGLAARDAMVLDALHARRVPVAVAMAGGYADDVDDVVDIHLTTIGAVLARYAPKRVLDWNRSGPGPGPLSPVAPEPAASTLPRHSR